MASVLDTITTAGRANKLVRILYRKLDGTTSNRVIEPYEYKDGMIWGWDTSKNDHIRQFFLTGILQAEMLEETFDPRYLIKL